MKFESKLTAVSASLITAFALSSGPVAAAETTTVAQSNLYDQVNIKFTQAYQTRSSELVKEISEDVSDLSGTAYHEPVEASLLHLNQFIADYNEATDSVKKAETTQLQSDIDAAKTQIAELPSSEVAHKSTFTSRVNAVVKANEEKAAAKKAAEAKAQAEAAAAAQKAAEEAAAKQAAQEEAAATKASAQEMSVSTSSNNPYGLKYTGYSSIDSARAHRNMIEQGGNMNIHLSLSYDYIGGYGFARSTWIALCQVTGTSTTDFSVAHQNLLADTLVRDYFGGDWGNVPTSGGW